MASQIVKGTSLHDLGAATEKARPPLSLHLVLGTRRRDLSNDLRDRVGLRTEAGLRSGAGQNHVNI